MKKIIALTLVTVIFLFCLSGCRTSKKDVHETFYGVARFSKIINGLIVYIPEYGEVMIPENDG